MKTYTVTISEELVRTLWVQAPDEETAVQFITDKYENGEIVLEAGDYVDDSTDIRCIGESDVEPDFTVA